jgi:hypothetical protein
VSDDLTDRLRGLDEARPMPPELRERMERALLAGDALGADLALTDRPRPIAGDLQLKLEAALLETARGEAAGLPTGLRRRLERRLIPRRFPMPVVLAAAAAVIIVVASATLLVGRSGGRRTDVAAGAQKRLSGRATSDASQTTTTLSAVGSQASLSAGAAATGGAGGAKAFSADAASGDPAPPFAFGAAPGALAANGSAASKAPAARSQLTVGLIAGDADQEKGFRAYIDLLNRSGGAGGHRLVVAGTDSAHPANGAVATANLGNDPVATSTGAPAWVRGPLLETLTVPEAALKGSVFSMASVLERQAHLSVDAAFPAAAPGKQAVIYLPPNGLYADRVAGAFDEALRAKQIVPVRQTVRAGSPIIFVDADAAFVSLPPTDAGRWTADAKTLHYSPAFVGGVASLFDEGLAATLPGGTRVTSPYRLLTGSEADALRGGAGRQQLNARLIHGWVTAKWLAVAIWSHDADTPAEVQSSLEASGGYDSGWAPPYEVRPGTRSRTPEGADLRPSGSTFTSGPFRKDRL